MDKKELQKAQNIIDALFYDDKVLTQWQHTLLENVISIAQTKLRQPDVSRSFIGLFMHYDNGDMVNIQDLPKLEYEKFLEQMNSLRMAYITLVSRP